jgi:hypothetical protein
MRLSAFASQSKNSKERRDRDTSRKENGERYTEREHGTLFVVQELR